MKGKIVTHAKLQYYRHNYCLVCMTGLLGCRWHRYQQSTRDSRKRDLAGFVVVLLAFLYMLFFFYFWLVIKNDIDYITLNMYPRVGEYIPWYSLGLSFSCVAFAYFTVIMMLSMLHLWHGHQLYIHPFHLLLTAVTLVSCVVVTILIDIYWPQEWPLLFLSLQVYGPFLQITAVIVMTMVSLIICLHWYKFRHLVAKCVWLAVFCLVMLSIYLSPLAIKSPLVRSDTPVKPRIVALAGASEIAPENTLLAFQRAVDLGVTNFYTTVQLSADGVPFLFTDTSLDRTTNARAKVSENDTYVSDPSFHTMESLSQLDAGSWFLEHDPWGVADRLTDAEKRAIRSQTILTLSELLSFLSQEAKDAQVFLKYRPMPADHPLWTEAGGQEPLESAVKSALMNVSDVMDFSQFATPEKYSRLPGVRALLEEYGESQASHLIKGDTIGLLPIKDLSKSSIDAYKSEAITSVALSVNTDWLFSFVWCAGVDMIVTQYLHKALDLKETVWHLRHSGYLALWITLDIVSAVLIIAMFIIQRIRLYGSQFTPESMSLNTGRAKTSYRSRTMKEKLLRSGGMVDSIDDLDTTGGVLNQPVYSMASGHPAYSLTSLPVLNSAANGETREVIITESPSVSNGRSEPQNV